MSNILIPLYSSLADPSTKISLTDCDFTSESVSPRFGNSTKKYGKLGLLLMSLVGTIYHTHLIPQSTSLTILRTRAWSALDPTYY